MTIDQLYQIYLRHPSIQTDTRKLRQGDLFFALKGPNFNGNTFAVKALEQGAAYAVIEMGANHQKEIEGYCKYTLPTHGIITNAGKAHLEGFGGPEGVKKGKGELYDFLRSDQVPGHTSPDGQSAPSGGTAFVMWDYDYLRTMSQGIPQIIKYGTHDADIIGYVHQGKPGSPAGNDSFLTVDMTGGPTIHTQLVGDYNLPNVLVAVAVGKHFGVSDTAIRQSIEEYTPSNSRSQLIQKDSNHIILDAYNANPSSMRAAIENFARLVPAGTSASPEPTNNKILILGAMAELGAESLAEHQGIVDLIGQYPWREVVLVGGDFQKLQHPYRRFDNSKEAGEWFRAAGVHDAYLLIKGSRSTKMEEVLL